MTDDETPIFDPRSDDDVRRICGKAALLQARLDQHEEGMRLQRKALDHLHQHGLVEFQRIVGRELSTSFVSMLAAWAFASLELAEGRAKIEEAELHADELRHKTNSPENRDGEEWKEGEADQG